MVDARNAVHAYQRDLDGTPAPDCLTPVGGEIRAALGSFEDGLSQSVFLFESSWKKPYTDRGIRKILARYSQAARITQPVSPHRLRHFLFTWLKTQRLDDALIQPYSGHATRRLWRSTPTSPWRTPNSDTRT
jgi:integrase/recombinase XerD